LSPRSWHPLQREDSVFRSSMYSSSPKHNYSLISRPRNCHVFQWQASATRRVWPVPLLPW
jgi:hypothetical protein